IASSSYQTKRTQTSALNSLAAQLRSQPEVKKLEINPYAESLIVYFDRSRLLLQDLLSRIRDRARIIRPTGKAPTRSVSKKKRLPQTTNILSPVRSGREVAHNGTHPALKALSKAAIHTLGRKLQHIP